MENFVLEPTELATERPGLLFEDGRYSIPDILDSHLLPLVVEYDSGGQPAPFNKFHFDLTQPLLLYKKRNIQKVAATSLHIQGDKYEDLGESLLIPEDYKGWFAVLQRLTGYTKADDTVPHFASVEELANSNTEKFLIGGTKKISGLQILDRSEGQIKHEQRYFFPGDTLTAEKVEFGEAKKRTRLFRKPKYIREKFLMCTDESDRDILMPFEQEGIFYQISHKSGKPIKNVMQMSDIVARKLTPRIIKLVFGRFPVTPCAFTGLMKAESSRIETSVIAATIVNKQNILMEIPINNELFFKIAITNDDLRQNTCYRNAMHFCAERASTYMRNIKICYNFALRGAVTNDFVLKTPPPESCAPSGYVPFDGTNKEISKSEDKTASNIPTEIVRHSDISDISDVSIRPCRCASTGRMSFCLGNSYLTVPVYANETEKRNSGNNNTAPEMSHTTKGCSRISFNGKFLEMEGDTLPEEDEASASLATEEYPPPMSCTNISSYVNIVSPPKAEVNPEFPDYIPTSLSRRPSSQPPDTAPPPVPLSSSTSGVSSGSMSSVSDGVSSKRASSDSFEYDVPKTDSSGSSSSSASRVTITSENNTAGDTGASSRMRRPSTYTFAEGCVPAGRGFPKKHVELMEELEESRVDVDSPIYENIQSLMEICKKLDLECGHMEQSYSNSELARSVSDESLTECSGLQGDVEKLAVENSPVCVPNEYCEPPIEDQRELCYDESAPIDESDVSERNLKRRNFGIACTSCDGVPTLSHSCSTLSASPKSLKSLNSDSMHAEEGVVNCETQDVHSASNAQSDCDIAGVEKDSCIINKDRIPDREQNVDNKKAGLSSSSEDGKCGSCGDLDDDVDTRNINQSSVISEISGSDFRNKTDMMFDFDVSEHGMVHCDAGDDEISCAKEYMHAKQIHIIKAEPERADITDSKEHELAIYGGSGNVNTIMLPANENSTNIDAGDKILPDSVSEESTSPVSVDDSGVTENWQCALRKVRRTRSSNSGYGDSTRDFPSDHDELRRLSSSEVREHFKSIGIRDASLNQIEELDINGMVIIDVLNGEKNLRESMGSVNLIDQQKISMYIRGWRPQTE